MKVWLKTKWGKHHATKYKQKRISQLTQSIKNKGEA
tara:strand:+ start:415 stop:522 length:108 start_codon:yes stop_codon:yes gene_type:complete